MLKSFKHIKNTIKLKKLTTCQQIMMPLSFFYLMVDTPDQILAQNLFMKVLVTFGSKKIEDSAMINIQWVRLYP